MDKIQEQWPEWQAEELLGKGTFGEVYKAKKEVYGNVSYAAIKVIEIPKTRQRCVTFSNRIWMRIRYKLFMRI